VDEGEGREAVRSLWLMDIDGSHRRKLTDHAREPFWRHDGKVIGFLPQEYPKFNVMDFYTKGMSFFDLATGEITPHVNTTNLFHLYNPGFSADDKWIVSTVHAGMGMEHAIILIEAKGTNIINLDIPGCRPCFSPDGKKLAWGAGDHEIALAPIDLSAARPSIGKWSLTVTDPTNDTYHVDWSPDSRFVSISTGPATRGDATKPGTFMAACEIVGVFAPGWNIVVVPADRTGTLELDKLTDADLVRVTTNGFSNKESAWFAAKPQKERAK
jgi:Tol biopolymer transport system component